MKTLLSVFSLCIMWSSVAQTNAPDITPTDCVGDPHNLYSELDAGKIIVVGWTMPCSVCAPPLLSVHNKVLDYAISNPGEVELWIFDDFSNTDCFTLKTWCNTNGINNATFFSDPVMNMQDFGGIGMPKVVVLGCTSHHIYYIGNNNFTGVEVGAAIDEALSDKANGCILSTDQIQTEDFTVFPNPANEYLNVSGSQLDLIEKVSVYSITGELILNSHFTDKKGELASLNVKDLKEGSYFIQISYIDQIQTKRFVIQR